MLFGSAVLSVIALDREVKEIQRRKRERW